MTDRREIEPQVELTTTRIGGGGTARLVALAAVVVLGGVAYLGFSGRTAPVARPAASQPSDVALASPTTLPPAQPPGERISTVREIVSDPDAARPYVYLGLGLWLGGQQTLAVLREVSPGHLHAAYRIPFPRPASSATLTVADIGEQYQGFHRYGSWDISLDPLAPETRQTGIVLNTAQLPDAAAIRDPSGQGLTESASLLLRNGYRVQVRAESRLDFGVLEVDVKVGSDPFIPNEGYSIDTRVGRRHFVTQLSEVEPGRLVGRIVLPDSLPMRTLPFRLRAVPMADPLIGRVTVDTFSIPLPPPREFGTDETLLDVSFAPRPIRPGEAQITAGGYRLIARSDATQGDRFTEFELLLNPIPDSRLTQ